MHGVQGVASSNPAVPTNVDKARQVILPGLFLADDAVDGRQRDSREAVERYLRLSLSALRDQIVRISRMAKALRPLLFRVRRLRRIVSPVDFSDSTFAALNLAPEEPLSWGRMLGLALILTFAAASAGILAGGLSL